MKKLIAIILILITIYIFWGCSVSITRYEEDVYTITEIDTVRLYEQTNAPGNRDNGIIFPSSRTFVTERTVTQRDSIVERKYPDFIRLGLFEGIGLINGLGDGYGAGMFGIYPDFGNSLFNTENKDSYVFSGGLYRFGIGEWRLRWFQDAPDWTIGTSVIEYIVPNSKPENTLASIVPLYLRKRWFLRREIPYIAITAAGGIGYYPSQYVNLSASVDIGSIGGLNIRAYMGYAFGQNNPGTPQMEVSSLPIESHSVSMPYFGIGASFLDFLNLVPETEKEWKEHEHSSWDVGLIQFAFVSSGADNSVFASEITRTQDGNPIPDDTFIKGFILKVANASVSLPFIHQNLYVGTSLLNLMILGESEYGIGIAPIRVGWWQTILKDELSAEPFVEMNYYPSTILNIGGRLNLRLSEALNIGLTLGYASGRTDQGFGSDIQDELGDATSFSATYIGITFGIFDRIFFPEELRYNK